MDRELLYNKSGIKDVTAYKAILRSGGGTTNMNNYEINKGEIWEVDNNGSTRLVVVLACFERYAATVILHYLGKAGRTGSRTTGRQRSVFRRQDTKQAVHQKDTGRRTGVYDLGSKRQ